MGRLSSDNDDALLKLNSNVCKRLNLLSAPMALKTCSIINIDGGVQFQMEKQKN